MGVFLRYKALILCIVMASILMAGCTGSSNNSSATGTPTAASTITASPSGSSPSASASSAISIDETKTIPAGSYVYYKILLDNDKSVNISIKTDGSPIDCLVMYDEALKSYEDVVAGTGSGWGYQKKYTNVVEESNTFTSTNLDQYYYVVLDNTDKAGDANAGKDVSTHITIRSV
jgi:hypothetical protein